MSGFPTKRSGSQLRSGTRINNTRLRWGDLRCPLRTTNSKTDIRQTPMTTMRATVSSSSSQGIIRMSTSTIHSRTSEIHIVSKPTTIMAATWSRPARINIKDIPITAQSTLLRLRRCLCSISTSSSGRISSMTRTTSSLRSMHSIDSVGRISRSSRSPSHDLNLRSKSAARRV